MLPRGADASFFCRWPPQDARCGFRPPDHSRTDSWRQRQAQACQHVAQVLGSVGVTFFLLWMEVLDLEGLSRYVALRSTVDLACCPNGSTSPSDSPKQGYGLAYQRLEQQLSHTGGTSFCRVWSGMTLKGLSLSWWRRVVLLIDNLFGKDETASKSIDSSQSPHRTGMC